jgi:hypothetical protein
MMLKIVSVHRRNYFYCIHSEFSFFLRIQIVIISNILITIETLSNLSETILIIQI